MARLEVTWCHSQYGLNGCARNSAQPQVREEGRDARQSVVRKKISLKRKPTRKSLQRLSTEVFHVNIGQGA